VTGKLYCKDLRRLIYYYKIKLKKHLEINKLRRIIAAFKICKEFRRFYRNIGGIEERRIIGILPISEID
jgi:hypothetical protein